MARLLIDPKEADARRIWSKKKSPPPKDVTMLSGLVDEAQKQYSEMKKQSDYYNYSERTTSDLFSDIKNKDWWTLGERAPCGIRAYMTEIISDVKRAPPNTY